MNAVTQAYTAEPNHTTTETPGQTGPTVSPDQLRKQEADRAFEAAVQWVLAVSRAA